VLHTKLYGGILIYYAAMARVTGPDMRGIFLLVKEIVYHNVKQVRAKRCRCL
jgi:hypothetical protein